MSNSFGARSTLRVGDKEYEIYRLDALEGRGGNLGRLPYRKLSGKVIARP